MTKFEVCQQLLAIPVIFFSVSAKGEDLAADFAHQCTAIKLRIPPFDKGGLGGI
jgi:hypothetical protein